MTKDVDTPEENGRKPISYGNPIVGVWRCLSCRYECFPRHLRERDARQPFICPECGTVLTYDEEE